MHAGDVPRLAQLLSRKVVRVWRQFRFLNAFILKRQRFGRNQLAPGRCGRPFASKLRAREGSVAIHELGRTSLATLSIGWIETIRDPENWRPQL